MQERYERYEELIRQFSLLDDDFMKKCFENGTSCIQLILRIILKQPKLTLVSSHGQHYIKNLWGRSIQADIYAQDTSGNIYDVEVQKDNKGADARRARYNSSLIDANIFDKGCEPLDLPESYVIFVTKNDVLKGSCPVYHVERCVRELGSDFNDCQHIIYVNAGYEDDTTPLGRLMHDFRCKDVSEMYYKELAERVRYLKETREGVNDMCKIMEDLRAEGRAEGIAVGRAEVREETAVQMLRDGVLPYDKIALYAGISLERVMILGKEMIA